MAEGMKVEGFDCLVDKEHKSTQLKLLSFAKPHMRAFHLNWFGFFTSFVSVFAPAAMLPVIRECLGIDANDLGSAGTLQGLPGRFVHTFWISPQFGSPLPCRVQSMAAALPVHNSWQSRY
jgi:hypothetical protein